MRLIAALFTVLFLVPIEPTAARVIQTVKVTKKVTVRTVTTRKIIRSSPQNAHYYVHRHPVYHVYRHPDFYVQRLRAIFVRRIHPESCFLSPLTVVELNAKGPYCDSPRGWHRVVVRY